MMKPALVMALSALFPIAALAQAPADTGPADASITASEAHVLSANPMTAAATMKLANSGTADCTLSAVSGDIAQQIALHSNVETDGIMKMVPIEGGIVVPAGGEVDLGAGGDHIMLMGLNKALEPGDQVDLVLDFGDCGTLPVVASVVALPGHSGHGMDHSMDHGMDHGMDHDAAAPEGGEAAHTH